MQDYIFNSRRQAAYRRRRLFFRLLLLLLIAGGGYFLADRYLIDLTGNSSDSDESGDLLPLPPVNESLPAQSRNQTTPTPVDKDIPEHELVQSPVTKEEPLAQQEVADEKQNAVAEQAVTPVTEKTQDKPLHWLEHTVGKGETLASIFKQQALSPTLLHKIVSCNPQAKNLARIRPGQKLRFALDEENKLQQLILDRSRTSSLQINRTDEGFNAKEISRPVEKRYATATGLIKSSLFVDGQKAGLSDAQIMEMAQIFGWDIDFALEIREGDQFHVIFEEQYLDGEKLKNGPILAAEFINRGNIYKAIRYTDKAGDTSYYDAEGNAKRRAFIRTPVKFARISSRFTRKRWHPVLKRWRSHKGVDYAAPRGTPVKATGNGKVVFRGKKGGYGNVIFLRHGGKYTTVYGHLSRFAKGLKNGKAVKQGQVIGYVGSTGLATGPHLHYEFRVHGKHRNPLTIKLPKSIRLPKSELARFRKTTAPLIAQLDELRAKTMVASAR